MSASLVVLSSRPPDWSREQFTTWWRGEHADYATGGGIKMNEPGNNNFLFRHESVSCSVYMTCVSRSST